MRVAVAASEARVALTQDVVKKLLGAGSEVAIESDAGPRSGVKDEVYPDAGATVAGLWFG